MRVVAGQGQRPAPRQARGAHRLLGTLVVAITEVGPPQRGGHGQAKDGGQGDGERHARRGGPDADRRDRLAERHDDQGPGAFGVVGRPDIDPAAGVGDQRGEPLERHGGRPQQVGGRHRGECGADHQQRCGDVERRDPDDVPVHPVEQRRVENHHEQVTEAEGEPVAGVPLTEPMGNRQAADQEAGHADEQQQPFRCAHRRAQVAQPRVSAVHPPQHAEHQQHLERTAGLEVMLKQGRELGEGEREDQVEEQLQGGHPQRHVRGFRGVGVSGSRGAGIRARGTGGRSGPGLASPGPGLVMPGWAWSGRRPRRRCRGGTSRPASGSAPRPGTPRCAQPAGRRPCPRR